MKYGPRATVKYRSWIFRFFPSWVAGFTFRRTIHVRRAAPATAGLLAHEYRHVMQYTQLGVLRFLWRYLREKFRHGYIENFFERDARIWGSANQAAFAAAAARSPRRLDVAFHDKTGEIVAVIGGNLLANEPNSA